MERLHRRVRALATLLKQGLSSHWIAHSNKSVKRWPLEVAALMLAVVVMGGFSSTNIPTNTVAGACSVGATEFDSWFHSGTAALDGAVDPADSLHFSDVPNCDFYKWSAQMFLWLTSPAPLTYGGGGGRIFDSPVFYDVSPPVNGDRTLIAHRRGFLRDFQLRSAQHGPHDLPVIFSTSRQMFEIVPPKLSRNGKQLILDGKGNEVEIGDIRIDPIASARSATERSAQLVLSGKEMNVVFSGKERNARPVFLDKGGKEITGVRPIIPKELMESPVVQRFMFKKIPIFLGPSGNAVDMEQGQAGGGGVLESQTTPGHSLVYYATMVNDVYAYFLTGAKNGATEITTPTHFPCTSTELQNVVSFAAAHGKVFPDPEAMAVEIKTSWVEASTLPSATGYITMTAQIPTYDDTTDPDHLWTPLGHKTVLLAMVGIHVVGSTIGHPFVSATNPATNGHPELIWATFEHQSNVPNAGYSYLNNSGGTTNMPPETGNWLFCSNASPGPFNLAHMIFDETTASIKNNATTLPPGPFIISPSDTQRSNAWGAAPSEIPNPIPFPTATVASSNTDIISINNSFRLPLQALGDVRGNYVFGGATWTINGLAPRGRFGEDQDLNQSGIQHGNEVGTSRLSNCTMETYQQRDVNVTTDRGTNCFTCHGTDPNAPPNQLCTVDVSHIYWTEGSNHQHGLQPLFH